MEYGQIEVNLKAMSQDKELLERFSIWSVRWDMSKLKKDIPENMIWYNCEATEAMQLEWFLAKKLTRDSLWENTQKFRSKIHIALWPWIKDWFRIGRHSIRKRYSTGGIYGNWGKKKPLRELKPQSWPSCIRTTSFESIKKHQKFLLNFSNFK